MPRPDHGPGFRIVVDGVERGRAALLPVACQAGETLMPGGAIDIVDPVSGQAVMTHRPREGWQVTEAGEAFAAAAPIGHPPRRFAWQDRADLT